MIEIVDYKPFTPKENKVSFLKGFLRIRIKTDYGWLECKNLQVYSKNGQHWVNFPSKVHEGPEGKKYVSDMYFEKESHEKWCKAIFLALREWKKPEQGVDTGLPQTADRSANKQPPQPISMSPVMPMQDLPDGLPF